MRVSTGADADTGRTSSPMAQLNEVGIGRRYTDIASHLSLSQFDYATSLTVIGNGQMMLKN